MQSVNGDDTSESSTFKSARNNYGPPDLRILAFNDVYHIEAGSAEPVGGIARFQTVANYYRSDPRYADQSKLITLFSGDAFNPSLESSVTKGRHMVPILNSIGTDVACVGVSTGTLILDCLKGDVDMMSCRTMTWILGSLNSAILANSASFLGYLQTSWTLPLARM